MIITRHTLERVFALFMLLTTRNKETSARYGANSFTSDDPQGAKSRTHEAWHFSSSNPQTHVASYRQIRAENVLSNSLGKCADGIHGDSSELSFLTITS